MDEVGSEIEDAEAAHAHFQTRHGPRQLHNGGDCILGDTSVLENYVNATLLVPQSVSLCTLEGDDR